VEGAAGPGVHGGRGVAWRLVLPRVGVFFTGGTIDSVGADRLDLAWYIEAGQRLEKGAFLERIPEVHG
jgi:hypothetical protein